MEKKVVVEEFKKMLDSPMDTCIELNIKQIFEKLNFSLKKGECIGIIGTTGIGKSTFVDIFCGLLKQKGGNIFINKKLVNDYEVNWGNLIGYVPQNYYLIDGSIKDTKPSPTIGTHPSVVPKI